MTPPVGSGCLCSPACRVCEQRGWALAATYCPFWCLVARKGHNRGFCDRRIATQQVGAGSCHNATKGRPLVSHRQRPAFSICSSVNLPPPAGYWDLFVCWTWSSLADYFFFSFFCFHSNISVSLILRVRHTFWRRTVPGCPPPTAFTAFLSCRGWTWGALLRPESGRRWRKKKMRVTASRLELSTSDCSH